MNEQVVTGLVALLALGAVAQWVAFQLKFPSIIALMLVGFVAGPLTGLLETDRLLGPLVFPLVSLGAAVVLFEGGMTTSLKELRSVADPVRRLITVGLLVTWVGTAIAARHLLGLSWELAVLLGAILVVTGPTVIGPILRHAKPQGQVGRILKVEGVLNDPLGAVLAVLVFQLIEGTSSMGGAISVVSWGIFKAFGSSLLLGGVSAWLYLRARAADLIPAHLHNGVLIPLALLVHLCANQIQHEAGLLAVTVMGIALASQSRVSLETSVEFIEHTRGIIISLLFVVLTSRMKLSDFTGLPMGTVFFLASLVLAIRPVSVILSTLGTNLSWRERIFISLQAPRGIVAAAVSSVFSLRLLQSHSRGAEMLLPVTFLVIALCVLLYGLGAKPLVRWLQLRQKPSTGVLILGANHLARELARCLTRLELAVTLVDTDRGAVQRARFEGLKGVHGRILSERVLNALDLSQVGALLALTSQDDANTLAVTYFRKEFGKERVHQVHPSGSDGDVEEEYASKLRGSAVAPGYTYEELISILQKGGTVNTLQVPEHTAVSDFESNGTVERIALCGVDSESRVRATPARGGTLRQGEHVLYLERRRFPE